jgi:hypothetical protein
MGAALCLGAVGGGTEGGCALADCSYCACHIPRHVVAAQETPWPVDVAQLVGQRRQATSGHLTVRQHLRPSCRAEQEAVLTLATSVRSR